LSGATEAVAKKPEAKRTESKPADRPRHAAPERVAHATRAQPEDPYGPPVAGPPGPPDAARSDPETIYRTGLKQYLHGDNAGALATFRALAASNHSFAPTWRGLGLIYEKLGKKAQAREAFRTYLRLAPGADDADHIRDRLEHLGS
jgi:tetratricopeptide (TPR) repeat protein